MRAAVVHKFGPPKQVVFDADFPVPQIENAHQILIHVKAAGVNPVDTYIRSGSFSQLPSLPYVPGWEGSGLVEKIGSKVKSLKVGERVWFITPPVGACAEFALASSEDHVHHLPENVSFKQGATLGVAYLTAYKAIFDKGAATSGQSVFIHGISGGVGLAACQLAKAKGLRVYGTAGSKEGAKLAKESGAERVYFHNETKKGNHYIERVLADHPDGFDLVLEMLANKNLAYDLELVASKGRIVVVGSRGRVTVDPSDIMGKEAHIVGIVVASSTNEEIKRMARDINTMLANSSISPVVTREFPLEEVAMAHKEVIEQSGGARGKMVIRIDHD